MKYKINKYIQLISVNKFIDFRKYTIITSNILILIIFVINIKNIYNSITSIWMMAECCIWTIGFIALFISLIHWSLDKLCNNSKFVYNSREIIKVENAPIMLNILLYISIVNKRIQSISQAAFIDKNNIYIALHYKFDTHEKDMGYASYGRNRPNISNISYNKIDKTYGYYNILSR